MIVYWGDKRPEEIDKRCLKSPKMTAICALNAKKETLGACWFENSRGRNVTVDGDRNRKVLNRINEDLNQLHTPNQKIGSSRMVQLLIYSTRDSSSFAHIVWKQNLEPADY